MNNANLRKVTLIINLACLAVGVIAYDMVASNREVVSTTIASLVVLAGAYVSTSLITQRMGGVSFGGNENSHPALAAAAKLLVILPVILTSFEVICLLALKVEPQSVSWIHIVAAAVAGQNAEMVFRKIE